MGATWVAGGLGLCVVLLVFLVSCGSSLPLSYKAQHPLRTTKDCVNPEECCKFVGLANEFNKCCREHGCCPLSCHGTHQGRKSYGVSPECRVAWECCRFLPQTPEFHKCCSAHGCCPPCNKVSRGCCHNGIRYEWGSVVEDFPELCLQLVCAAQVSTNTWPALNAVIVPVNSPSLHCEERQCNDCVNYRCVDGTGLLRAEGDRWVIEGCQECMCQDGKVECVRLEVDCPPRPLGHCVEVPGPCCPEWECTVMHQDCTAVSCPAPPRPGCQPIIPEGQCCAVDWRCGDCPDLPCPGPPTAGCKPFYPPLACCPEWDCSPGCSAVICPGPPQPSCRPIIPEGECCAVDWVCPDCSLVLCEGPPHPGCRPIIPVGECCAVDWVCPNCSAVRCAGPPQPGCRPIIPAGECCAVDWICGCVDDQGLLRDEGENWQDPVDPCSHCVCRKGEVKCFLQDCAPPPPWPCHPPRLQGQCCPNYCDPPPDLFDNFRFVKRDSSN
ncbi:uncharacterized protein [Panulirus ornatus]|uniref:uncharacterized protein isoform X2 n=1 Tax=Panulirus ornatus TaxID=150431 RepID=UPI003A8BA87B